MILILLARLLLAAVFVASGVAKLADRDGSRASLRGFRVPGALVPALAWALPSAELLCAALLFAPAFAWWGAIGAAGLLAAFTIGIGLSLANGRRPACHCFGQVSSSPIGTGTVVRNLGLLAVAVFVVAQPGATAASGFNSVGLSPAVTLLALALAAQTVVGVIVLLHLLRQNGRMLLRVEALEEKLGAGEPREPIDTGLRVGAVAPAFALKDLNGRTATLAQLEAGAPGRLLLVFSEPDCHACEALLPEVSQWQSDHASATRVVLVSRDSVDANRVKLGALDLAPVLLQKDREVAEAFGVVGTPSAVIIEGGHIASPLAAGAHSIRELVARAAKPAPLEAGDAVPSLVLRKLDAGAIDLRDIPARDTVLLFWNPGCGYCQALLDEVKAWERHGVNDGVGLVVIAAGSPAANREQGFVSRVLLDPKYSASDIFGVAGTPAAVLLTGGRFVAAPPAVGAPQVLKMLARIALPAVAR